MRLLSRTPVPRTPSLLPPERQRIPISRGLGHRQSIAAGCALYRPSLHDASAKRTPQCRKIGSDLLAPGREGVVEGALARRPLLDRDDGAPLIGIDQRHIEPGPFLQQLNVALPVGID